MRLHSPAERYIKYLFLHGDKLTVPQVKEKLADANLDYISDAYLEKVKKALKPPELFYPSDERHAASARYIMDEGVYRLFHQQLTMKTAFNILARPRVKEYTEAMLILRTPLQAIANFLRFQWRVAASTQAIEDYKHCFCDMELLDSTGTRILQALHIDLIADDVPELKDRTKILKSAFYKDARVEASELPSTPGSALLVQARMGFRAKHYDAALGAMEAIELAVQKAQEALLRDGPGDHMKFVNLVNGARMLNEMRELLASPSDRMHDEFKALSIQTAKDVLPTAFQLSGGNMTVDLEPKDDHGESDSPSLTGTRAAAEREPAAGAPDPVPGR